MAGRTKRLVKAAAALAAGALVQKAVEQAVKSPRMRRRASELQKAAGNGRVPPAKSSANGRVPPARSSASGRKQPATRPARRSSS
jgi:hypothetical protein